MFEVGWTEMLVIAVVLIVVVGPKDLPKMLRTFGRTMAKVRAMAGDFQKQFNDALKEADLEDVKDSINSVRSLNPMAEIRKQLNPMEKAASDIRAGVDAAMKPRPVMTPAAATPQAVEPLKAGPTAIPGETPAPVAPAESVAPAELASSAEIVAAPIEAPVEIGLIPAPIPAPLAENFVPPSETKH